MPYFIVQVELTTHLLIKADNQKEAENTALGKTMFPVSAPDQISLISVELVAEG